MQARAGASDNWPEGRSAAQAGDHRAGHPQAQGEDAREIAQHEVGKRGFMLVQRVEGLQVEPDDLDVRHRVERGRARVAVEERELAEYRGRVDRLERTL